MSPSTVIVISSAARFASPKSIRCGRPAPVHHDVAGLQVPVDDSMLVGINEGLGDRGEELAASRSASLRPCVSSHLSSGLPSMNSLTI